MGLEIERKFLVAGSDWREGVTSTQVLRQGYLTTGGTGVTVRVRTIDDAIGFITIKGGGSALSRAEFERKLLDADGFVAQVWRGARLWVMGAP